MRTILPQACAAGLLAAGLAPVHAQSSVTLFGIVDTTMSHYAVRGGTHQLVMGSSGLNNSALGFRGSEDLGGGLSANFWLEGALTSDDGTPNGLTFMRRSTVGLAGRWGEVRLGRDFTPSFWNDAIFDPFGASGAGSSIINQARGSSTAPGRQQFAPGFGANNPNYIRTSNGLGYFLPRNLGGFYGHVQYALHEQPSGGSRQGQYAGGRVGYAQGAFNVAAAVARSRGASPSTAAGPDVRSANLGASWNFGVASVMGEIAHESYDVAGVRTTGRGYLLGVLVPVGSWSLRAAHSHWELDRSGSPEAAKTALGAVYHLSKRTALYATYARISNRNGARLQVGGSVVGAPNATTTGMDLGLRHHF